MRTPARVASPTALAFTAALILGSTPLAAGRQTVVRGELGRTLDGYLSRLEGVGFSGAVLVANDAGVVLEKGYGAADRESGRAVTADTVFTTGSITKQFTAAAIMTLQMRSKLDVSDRITKYLDDVPRDKQSITIHHLLTHTAGFPPAIGDDFDSSATRDGFTRQALSSELLFEPGSRYEYSNVGYSLAGIIVEKVSGEPYEQYLREHLFTPAGMTRTGYLLPAYSPEELAVGYRDERRWGTILARPMLDDGPSWHLRANGGVHSTVGDMYRWHQTLATERVLSDEAKDEIFTPHADEGGGDSFYGYGWAIFETPWSSKLIAHNGGNGVFSSDFRRYVEDGFVIYASTNTATFAPVDLVTDALAELMMDRPVDQPPATVTLSPTRLARFAGRYTLPSGARFEVAAGHGALDVRAHGDEASDILAGRVSLTDPSVRPVAARTAEVLAAWRDDDLEPMIAVWGGRMGPEEVKAALGRVRSMREERFGAWRSSEVVGGQVDGELVEAIITLTHERGSAGLRFGWRDGRIVSISIEPPSRGVESVRIYPIDQSRFTSFDPHSEGCVEVGFEIAEDAERATSLTIGDTETIARRAFDR